MNKRFDINGSADVNTVYKTDDLSIFKFTKFNRNVLIRREMLEQAKEGFISPVIVNEHMIVIDGQHRIEHAKKVGVPVEYIIKPGLRERDIVRMNTTQKPWSLSNYIESYANQGIEEYVALLNLIKNNYAGVTDVVALAQGYAGSTSELTQKVKNGKFEFFNFQKTLDFLKFYQRFREETKTPKRTKVCFALYELYKVKGFDENRLIEKVLLKNFDNELRVKGFDKTEALKELIDKYNDRLSQGSPMFIEYYVKNNGTLIISNEKYDWSERN